LWSSKYNCYLPIDKKGSDTLVSTENISNSFLSKELFEKIHELPEEPPYDRWVVDTTRDLNKGYGYPEMNKPTNKKWDNCDDLDVLFQEDLATMLACQAIYDEYKSLDPLNGKEWNFSNVREWLKTQKLPEKYVFNSFIGDTSTVKYQKYSQIQDKTYEGYNKD
jgi:hypothetical protein